MMTSRASERRTLLPAVLALLAGLFLLAISTTADARRPMPQPTAQNGFMCEVPTDAANSVREAHKEYFECTQPLVDEWLGKFPDEVEQLEALYQSWENSNGADLRFGPEAARWVRQHPVDFTENRVELTPEQVLNLGPYQSAMPAEVVGTFERFFVDRDAERLFLTSKEEGLVALSIAERYAFDVEGSVGSQGGRDFFIYDRQTAFVEEPGEGANRDLVVLDISDRTDPIEVARLKGVLPEISSPHLILSSAVMDKPPTFDQYLAIRNGEAITQSCGQRPTVSTHQGVHCRPDGTCFTREHSETASSHRCVALQTTQHLGMVGVGRGGGGVLPPQPMPRPRSQVHSLGAMNDGMAMEERSPRAARSAAPAPTREAEPSPPQGGAGGAGSLSQMMVYGTTLYVLSAAENTPHGWLTSFDVSRARRPAVSQVLRLDNGPEALQRHDNLLLVAGRDAVTTVSLGEPEKPRLLGEFRQNCPVNFDPVVVQGTIAYRTIIVDHPRSMCTSRLEIIDLSQPHQPTLRSTTPITRPRGLAVLGDSLFVADESRGVIVFDITDPVNPTTAGTWKLPGVKDLVVSGFDLYAMTPNQVQTYYIGSLFEPGINPREVVGNLNGFQTIVRKGYRSGS